MDIRSTLGAVLRLMGLGMVLALGFVLLMYTLSDRDRPAAQRVDVSDLAEGQWKVVDWHGQKVLILHRDAAMRRLAGAAAGPWLVVLDRAPDVGCPLEVVPPGQGDRPDWPGGLRDRCRGSRYDFAGHVLPGEPSRMDLRQPGFVPGLGDWLMIGVEAPKRD